MENQLKCWIVRSPLAPSEIVKRITEKFLKEEPVTRDTFKGKKGLIQMPKGPYYRGSVNESKMQIRAVSPGGQTRGGAIFRAKGILRKDGNATELDIRISRNVSILLVMVFWFGGSGVGVIWSIYKAIADREFMPEMFAPLALIVVGLIVFPLYLRSRRKTVAKFKDQLHKILDTEGDT